MSKAHLADRLLHWISALLLLFMLMNLSSQLHNMDWDIKGQLEHRQQAVESHATVGLLLVAMTVGRLLYLTLLKQPLPRVSPTRPIHRHFIALTHWSLYLCIFGLVATGVLMINHYEIPLTVLGVFLDGSKQDFYAFFPDVHRIHMGIQKALWWLIGIHFVGILIAKK